jgi:hypothetical protein
VAQDQTSGESESSDPHVILQIGFQHDFFTVITFTFK